jgi:type VI protein secretion system component Hcp
MEHAEIYLDLKSVGIQGDALAEHYEGQIELWDWRWGLDLDQVNNDSPPHGKGTEIVITKPVDRATTAMLKYLERGPAIPKATLVLVQRTETNLMVRLELEGVELTSYKLKVDSKDKEVELSEDWSLSYHKIKVQYKGRAEKGSDVRGKVSSLSTLDFTLNVPKNADMKTPEPLSLGETKVDMADYKDDVTDVVNDVLSKQKPQFTKDDVHKMIDEYVKKNKIGSK